MKILILNDFKDNKGGAQVYDERLKNLLQEKGHEVKFYGSKDKGLLNHFSSIYSHKDSKRIKEIEEEFSPDIIFAHAVGRNLSPLLLKNFNASIIVKPPSVYLYTSQTAGSIRSVIENLLAFYRRKFTKRYVDKFVAPSKFMQKHLKQHFRIKKDKIRLIRNPTPYKTQRKTETTKEHNILFVGRIGEKKGINVLLDSIKKLKTEKNFRLNLVGPINSEEKLKREISQRNIEDRVNVLGEIQQKDLKIKYRASTSLALPSPIPENSPLVIPEAYSQGTPVITTNIGGQKELVKDGETGFLIEPENPEELAEKIKEIIENPELREKMSENALEYAEEFSKERHVEEMEKLFKEVMKEKSKERIGKNLKKAIEEL